MTKLWTISILVTMALVFSVAASPAAGMLIPASEKAKEKANAGVSPVIEKVDDHLALTPPGLERVVIVHYAKPPWAGGGKKETKNYEFLGKWVEWKELPVSYVIDPTNSGLTEEFVASAISAGAEEWDSWTGAELFNDAYEIVSDGSWDSDAPDGRNELLFGDYPEEGVIAVAIVWGYFTGPPSRRGIVEFDILFDTDFAWGDATVDPAVMDLQNIATHELGHGVGLADLYDDSCSEETMYGYSTEGETKKRSLNDGDIAGIRELYGA